MKSFFEDALYCLKLALYIFVPAFILGIIIGYFLYGVDPKLIVLSGVNVNYVVACAGLFLVVLSFTKEHLMRPLNYEQKWKMYFKCFNLSHVIFFIGLYILVFAGAVDVLAHYIWQ